jgi:putative ATP-dependent endonuclease of the OLD family
MFDVGFRISNYKCFGNDACGFDQIEDVNIIVGRNNTGKSALLDIIYFATQEKLEFETATWHNNTSPTLFFETPLSETTLMSVFSPNTSGGDIHTNTHWEFGRNFINERIEIQLGNRDNSSFSKFINPLNFKPITNLPNEGHSYKVKLANAVINPLKAKVFKRVYAERNIEPEEDSNELVIDGSGKGITNLIQNFINKVHLNSYVVEKELLEELNTICFPDATFTDIVCQKPQNGPWEIFLEQEHKGRIALSSTGSGMKTIIIVLCYILLLPKVEKRELNNYLFAFEELENNLHPALLRRLISFLLKKSKEFKFHLFFTTHSNVMIDILNQIESAQIIHVTHDSKSSFAKIAQTHFHTKGILSDLDVRASDLLQSNGIIWVEGPSDRVYLRKWIDLFSDGQLIEGLHYQTVFYGGKLLSHISADPGSNSNGVQLFHVNTNNILIIDSDKRQVSDEINATKTRISEEIERNNGVVWVTDCREIENYIPIECMEKILDKSIESFPKQFDSFFDWLNTVEDTKGTYYLRKKPLLAENIIPYMNKENLILYDFQEKIQRIVKTIKYWNNM